MMKRKRQQNAHFRANWGKGSGIIIGNLNSTFHIHFLLNPTQKQQRKGRTQSLKLQILTQFELLYYLKCSELGKSTLKTILIPHHRFPYLQHNSAIAIPNRTVEPDRRPT